VSADTVAEHHYRFLDAAITVQYRDAAAYAYTAPVLAGLEVPEADVSAIPCQLTRNDRGKLTFVMGGEVCVESLDPDAVAPAVLAAFANHAVRRSDFLMLVHGGVVSNGESAVLLPASAGSGKTTLTAALCHSGLEYLSDEVVLLQREACRVRPAPIPMCVKQPSWSLIGKRYPQLYDQPVHRRMDRQVVRYLAPPVAPGAVTGPLPVSHIVFPKYQAESPTHLEKLSPMAALARLLSECRGAGSALTQTDIAALVQWIAEVTCYSLSLGDLDEAVGVLMGAVFE
jgi:hypothetical protein